MNICLSWSTSNGQKSVSIILLENVPYRPDSECEYSLWRVCCRWFPDSSDKPSISRVHVCLPMKMEQKKKVMGMLTIGADMFRNQFGDMGKNLRKSRKKNKQSLLSSTWEINREYWEINFNLWRDNIHILCLNLPRQQITH